jgi:hypothetical protein
MSKKEVAAIQWLEMKTLKRLLATPPDHKTKTKPRASRNMGHRRMRGQAAPRRE